MNTPYHPKSVLANLRIWDEQLRGHAPNLTDGPGYVRHGVQEMLRRGIEDTAESHRKEIATELGASERLCNELSAKLDAANLRCANAEHLARDYHSALTDGCLLFGVSFDGLDPRKTLAKITAAVEAATLARYHGKEVA